jgi:D-3-phosphoglycerate dehydrogenase
MTEKKRILITDRFSSEAFLTLSQQSFFQVERCPFPHLQQTELAGVHALIIRSRTHINEDILKRAKQLQVIVTATSGFDHIDLKACEKWGITVMFTPTANIESAAQMTWALLLACTNKVINAHRALKSGEWNREPYIGMELSGKTIGIVGLGRIGKRVAEIADAFKMKIVAYDPYIEEKDFHALGAERLSYDELLKVSDLISFHVPKTQETYQMLKRNHFEYIHRGVIILNTSRGTVINELDLCEALDKGWVSCAGLDVFDKEPLDRNSKLLQQPNLVLTPHLGANTHDAFAKASEQAALKIISFFVDGTTSDTLPPKAPWYGATPAF